MKLNYLFVNHNNGHRTTYHPFTSSIVLTQERVTKWLMEIHGATRIGTTVRSLLNKLDENKIEFDDFICPCCEQVLHQLKSDDLRIWEVAGIKWILLEGVSGNY